MEEVFYVSTLFIFVAMQLTVGIILTWLQKNYKGAYTV